MATLFFSFGGLFQGIPALHPSPSLRPYQTLTLYRQTVSILLVNSIAILSEDRFLARST